MRGKCRIIQFRLGCGFMIEMVEAVGAPRQRHRQPGRPDMAHPGRDVADADADTPIAAIVRAGAVRDQRVVQ
jgi:hypothetical protein